MFQGADGLPGEILKYGCCLLWNFCYTHVWRLYLCLIIERMMSQLSFAKRKIARMNTESKGMKLSLSRQNSDETI